MTLFGPQRKPGISYIGSDLIGFKNTKDLRALEDEYKELYNLKEEDLRDVYSFTSFNHNQPKLSCIIPKYINLALKCRHLVTESSGFTLTLTDLDDLLPDCFSSARITELSIRCENGTDENVADHIINSKDVIHKMRDLRHITIELNISQDQFVEIISELKEPRKNIYIYLRKKSKIDTDFSLSLIDMIKTSFFVSYFIDGANFDTIKIGNNESKYTKRWISANDI
ncbi:MAG: hypothetical protein INQ03_21025 [Candidatus Heimdallarchaeota archaeon]|nr:hypothetical protein [Candidatus Heimdallarchaeota archaeon]